MRPLVIRVGNQIILTRRNRPDRPIEEATADDVSYLKFIFQKASEPLTDECAHAVHDALQRLGVSLKDL